MYPNRKAPVKHPLVSEETKASEITFYFVTTERENDIRVKIGLKT